MPNFNAPSTSPSALLEDYRRQLNEGTVQPDTAQSQAVIRLQNLVTALAADTPTPPRGLYLHGPVGRGKSWLMSLFFKHVTLPKRRVHFHAFMQELHQRLHATTTQPGQDLMTEVARQFAAEATVLAFDEFYITNIADAMLLGRLMQALFREGVVIVATSNWAPEDLFQGGVNRDRFLPFIRLLSRHLETINIGEGIDYRTLAAPQGLPAHFLIPQSNLAVEPQLNVLFHEYAIGATAKLPPDLMVKRHQGRAAWFTFATLCDRAYGREHYLELARAVDTIIIEGVPVFTKQESDAAIRFITLIDILYEYRRRVIISAAAAPHKLCTVGDAAAAFERTVSRIWELTSPNFIEAKSSAKKPAARKVAKVIPLKPTSPSARKSVQAKRKPKN